ncbi:MAG: transglycosylase SLT domain-containing protein, partial [bacterium]
MFLRSLALGLLFCTALYGAKSGSKSDLLPGLQAPMIKELKSEPIKQRLLSEKKYKSLLQFSLGVAYYKEEKYAEAYKVLSKVSNVPYLGDYIKYYRSASVFEFSNSPELLKKSLEDLYSVSNNGASGLSDDVKNLIPEFEFKIALALAKSKNFDSSLDYYARARAKGYSDLRSEFDLIKNYSINNKEMTLGLMLDLNRRFTPVETKKLFDTLPDKIRTDLYALASYKITTKDVGDQSKYRKTEGDLIASVKDAVVIRDSAKVKELSIEYLKDYPLGTYNKRFYDVSYSYIENSIISKEKDVSYYKSMLAYYDKNYLDKLVIKLFQKSGLDEVEKVLDVVLDKYPQHDKGVYLMATLKEDSGKDSSAIKYYKKIVDGFPQSTYYQRSLFKYAWLEMADSNYSDCIELFTRYIDEGQDNYDWSVTAALYFKAQCLEKKSRMDDAKATRQELVERFPYSFYALISMEKDGISLSEHINKNIKPLDTSAEAVSPQELKSIRTAIMLVMAGLVDGAVKELSNINLDKLSPGYIDLITSIYKYSSSPEMTIMAAGKLMNSLKGYASQEHAETHFPKLYFDNVKKFSDDSGIPPFIMLAIMKRESAFNKNAVSSSGALGLMQLMPDTALSIEPKIKTKSLTDPAKNIKLAASYLKTLLTKYDNNFIYVLASYNAGDDALTRWINWYGKKYDNIEFIENIPYVETRNYVKAVISNYYMYNALYLKKDVSFK